MGVRKTSDYLEKATWTFAIALLLFSIVSSVNLSKQMNQDHESVIKEQVQNATDYTQNPVVPSKEQVEQQINQDTKEEN